MPGSVVPLAMFYFCLLHVKDEINTNISRLSFQFPGQHWFVVKYINCFGSFCCWDVNMPSSYSFAVHGFRRRMHCWWCRRSRLTHRSASGAFQGYRSGSWVHNWDPELYWTCGWKENKGQHPQYTRIFLWTHSATFDTISASMPSYHLFFKTSWLSS